ncbi:MAG: CPBP family intramembrane metalloprotease [Ruminococcus sp.]|nr:CPBP family intramembrane metalloprotease [Ruminococcus sp.]MCM1382297.1 CPBP family intramembrane metalloprotease [Muribaculaceae bacterium]MCM1480674.1 CPBP family intramembrane metalloprotease [Muribaculaceae bacterium]
MDNYTINNVTVKPSPEERREIRREYGKTALVLLLNILIFNVISNVLLRIGCMIYGGGFSEEAFRKGAIAFSSNELLSTVYSCLVPIISETAAILTGLKILKYRPDFKSLATREGYGGGTVAKLVTLCIGLQTGAALLTSLITAILENFGLTGRTVDLSATTSFGANLFMFFYACLLGPVLEELLYRGILLQSMRKYNERFAIFLSAVIFGLMHENYQQFILGFLLGIPLAVVTIKYNSLIPSIITHILVNTTASVSNVIMQYFAPNVYEMALGGEIDMAALSGADWAVLALNAVFRYGFALAGLVVGIICLVKGKHMTKPTPAGKSRAFPVMMTSVPWIAVFIAYAYLSFVAPFMNTTLSDIIFNTIFG